MKKNANKSLPFFERQLNSGQKLKMEGVGGGRVAIHYNDHGDLNIF